MRRSARYGQRGAVTAQSRGSDDESLCDGLIRTGRSSVPADGTPHCLRLACALACVRGSMTQRRASRRGPFNGSARRWISGDRKDVWPQRGRARRCSASSSKDLAACAHDADLAIESVPENVALKRRVFAELDRVLPPNALLASNTSAIPPSRLATATGRPELVLNVNFGHLGHRKVELMGHAGTAPETIAAASAFLRELGLVPIVVHGEASAMPPIASGAPSKKSASSARSRVGQPEDIDRDGCSIGD